jgi:hypothetical protein
MTQIPSVADGLLQGTAAAGAAGLAVGSPAWFAWLADAARAGRVADAAGPIGEATAAPGGVPGRVAQDAANER